MALAGDRMFVGIGFGPIQAGLFLYEAYRSGDFTRLVTAEVLPDVVTAVRQANGYYHVNIAHADHIESARMGPIEILNPRCDGDRQSLVAAIAAAHEIATALPGVGFYASDAPGSPHRLLAAGLLQKIVQGGPPCIIYAAENHNRAAEILAEHILSEIPPNRRAEVLSHVCFANTVIGKMSRVVTDPREIADMRLETVAPSLPRAFLVESFNCILTSLTPPAFRRGITIFQEKDDLLPFEEAKLYGHNAVHALAAYIGAAYGVTYVADLTGVPGMMPFLRAAFLQESGTALIRRWAGVDDLFTAEGYRAYADDLLQRMVNPLLRDTVERVGRDPQRKLGWDDRLVGTMRVALGQDVQPRRFALGAAAALAALHPEIQGKENADVLPLLVQLWQGTAPDSQERLAIATLIAHAHRTLCRWEAEGRPPLEGYLASME